MNNFLPRKPAYTSLRPAPVSLRLNNNSNYKEALAYLNASDYDIYHLYSDNHVLTDKFVAISDQEKLFLRIDDMQHFKVHRLADIISTEVAKKGASVSTPDHRFPIIMRNDRYLLGYEYIEHRYSIPDEKEFQQIGTQLAILHNALQQSSLVNNVKKISFSKIETLAKLYEEITKDPYFESSYKQIPLAVLDRLRSNKFQPEMLIGNNSQVIHGDLNYGNICVSKDTSNIFFVDFESSCRTWLSPYCDLATVLDRHFLTLPNFNEKVFNSFLEAYFKETSIPSCNVVFLIQIIEQLVLRALLILVHKTTENHVVDESEWLKFTNTFTRISAFSI